MDTAIVTINVKICNGIGSEDFNANNIKIQPNTFEENFTLYVASFHNQLQKIEIFNIEGKIIESRNDSGITPKMLLGEM